MELSRDGLQRLSDDDLAAVDIKGRTIERLEREKAHLQAQLDKAAEDMKALRTQLTETLARAATHIAQWGQKEKEERKRGDDAVLLCAKMAASLGGLMTLGYELAVATENSEKSDRWACLTNEATKHVMEYQKKYE